MPNRSGRASALAAALLAWLMAGCVAQSADGTDAAPWPPAQRALLLSLGPWPPRAAEVPTAGAAAVALGERLFHSARLAPASGVRCATCHEPWRGFTDGRRVALGIATGARNTPTLVDVARHARFGWDGAQAELWRQSLRPLADPREMPADAAHVAALLRDDPQLAALRAEAFGTGRGGDDQQALDETGRALAAYVGTLASARTPFDDWRDAVADGAPPATPTPGFDPAARRGAQLFVGSAGCIACHAGATLGGDGVAVSMIHSVGPDGRPDTGRAGEPPNVFRVPALRGVAATAPYMHDGSVATLCDAVRPHALMAGRATPTLASARRRDLVAFLQSLSPKSAGGDEQPDCSGP